jgi:hypothetical protein
MIIERTNKEVIIRLQPTVDTDELQELANYFRYKEITSNYTDLKVNFWRSVPLINLAA